MKLAYYCHNCRSKNSIRARVSDRMELQKKRGSEIPLSCKSCQEEHLYHPNDMEAVEDPISNILAFLSMAVVLFLVKEYLASVFDEFAEVFETSPRYYYELPLLILLPIIVFMVFRWEHLKAIRLFNRYKV